MSILSDLIETHGDQEIQNIKTNLLELIQGAKSETESIAKETGDDIEKWLVLKVKGEINADELESLLNSRKRVVQQFLNSKEIAARARVEEVTLGLINIVLDKVLDSIV